MNKASQQTIIVIVVVAAIVLIAIQLVMVNNSIIIDCVPGYHPDYASQTCIPDDPVGTPTLVTLGIGQANPTETFRLTGVFADHVTGLQCYDYPVPTCEGAPPPYGSPQPQQGTPVSMTIGQQVTNGCTVTLRLESINFAAQQATFMQTIDNDPNKPCPICWWQLEAMDETTATRQ